MYNTSGHKPITINLFNECLSVIVKIGRTLGQTRGHILFIGSGGIGRAELTKLTAFIY